MQRAARQTVQNPVQQSTAERRNTSQVKPSDAQRACESPAARGALRRSASDYEIGRKWSRGESNPRAGLLRDCSLGHLAPPKNPSGAESGAVGAGTARNPDLDLVIDAWPHLPDHIRKTIQTLIESGQERG